MKKHMIFDLDGTLLDSMPVWEKIGIEFLKKNNIVPPKNFIDIIKKQTLPQTAEYFVDELHVKMSATEIVASIIDMVAYQYKYEVKLKPYALDFLKQQKKNGVKMCILTASELSYTDAAIKRLEILPYFEFVATCTKLGITKHDKSSFDIVASLLGGTNETTAVFEDALYAIRSAHEGGYYVVGVADDTALCDNLEIKKYSNMYISSYKELLR